MTTCPTCIKWRNLSALICIGLLALAISNAVMFHRWQNEIAARKSLLASPLNPIVPGAGHPAQGRGR